MGGIAVSGAVLLLAGIAATVVDFKVWTPPARGTDGQAMTPGWTTLDSIEMGDCFTPGPGLRGRGAPPMTGANVRVLPCDAAHRGEAYATFRLPEQDRAPARTEIAAIARPQCAKVCAVARPGNALLDSSVRLDAMGLDPAQADHLMALKPLNSQGLLRPVKRPGQDLAGRQSMGRAHG